MVMVQAAYKDNPKHEKFAQTYPLHFATGISLASSDVEINPQLYWGKKNEQSDNKKGELEASPKTIEKNQTS